MNVSKEPPVETRGGSDRSFGLVFAVVFAAIALWPLRSGSAPRWWALCLAVALLATALLRASVLGPENRLWTRFGLLLHRLTSPIAAGFLFYLLITPTGFVLRLFGRDALRLRLDASADTYWLPRNPPGPPPETMANQF